VVVEQVDDAVADALPLDDDLIASPGTARLGRPAP